jgi:hypothetical protein
MNNQIKMPPFTKLIMTIGQLPSSYLVSMTYEEQLLWLCNYIEKEIVPAINTNSEALIEIREYVDKYLTDMDEVKEQIILILDDINLLKTATEQNSNDIENINTNIEILQSHIENEINDLKLYVDTTIQENYNILKQYVDYEDNILNEKIDNIQIGLIQIYDPTTGTIEPLQIVINNLYALTNKDGLTASEFDGLELTATSFDAYQITAYEFDSSGKTILV